MGDRSLIATNVKKSFPRSGDQELILRGIDATFTHGTTYAIVGVSGVGKSTLMQILAGLDAPTSGTITFDGHDLAQFSAERMRVFHNQEVGLVFQSPYLLSELSVIQNVMLPGLIAGKEEQECLEWAQELLEKAGLAGRESDPPGALSGGQQQRVSFVRALFNRPAILFADEPTGNLDVKTGREIMEQLLVWQKEWGMTLIVGTHDAQVAEAMNVVYRVQDGVLKSV